MCRSWHCWYKLPLGPSDLHWNSEADERGIGECWSQSPFNDPATGLSHTWAQSHWIYFPSWVPLWWVFCLFLLDEEEKDFCSPPITITYLPTEICINILLPAVQDEPTWKCDQDIHTVCKQLSIRLYSPLNHSATSSVIGEFAHWMCVLWFIKLTVKFSRTASQALPSCCQPQMSHPPICVEAGGGASCRGISSLFKGYFLWGMMLCLNTRTDGQHTDVWLLQFCICLVWTSNQLEAAIGKYNKSICSLFSNTQCFLDMGQACDSRSLLCKVRQKSRSSSRNIWMSSLRRMLISL